MNQIEKELIKIEEDLKDTIENELIEKQKENKKIEIKDIRFVGKVKWKDRINENILSEMLFEVKKEITEIDNEGNKRITKQTDYYLEDKCIGASLGKNQVVFKESFMQSEPEKYHAVLDLLERVTEEEKNQNSLNRLHKLELAEVLSEHFGREISEDEVEKLIEEMNQEELEEINEEKEENKEKDYENDNEINELTEKQTEKIKVKGVQRADLKKLVDGRETLGRRLDLEEYDDLYVVYSEKVGEITHGEKVNHTTYSLIGTKEDGTAKVLNDEFEIDSSVGNDANREQTKIRADSTATKDNNDVSVYRRKTNGMSIGCENEHGRVNMFMYQKAKTENENVGIQIETQNTPYIPLDTREIMNQSKGYYHKDRVKNEIEEHVEAGCEPGDVKDFDGNENTETHTHDDINEIINDILEYENDEGQQRIKQVFTEEEVTDKLLNEIQENKDSMNMEDIIEKVKQEMDQDAQRFYKEHKI